MKETEDKSAKIHRIEKILAYIKTHQLPMACVVGLVFGYCLGRTISLIAADGDWHIAVITGISGGLYIAIICPTFVIHTLQVKLTGLRAGKLSWTDYYIPSPSMKDLLRIQLIGLGIMVTAFICLSLIFDYQWVIKSLH